MKFGSYDIPENRLQHCIVDVRKIYDTVKLDKITSKDLSKLLGYGNPTSGRFYARLKSLISYGLLQSGNTVSKLGYQTAYPESSQEDRIRKEAIFNIALWKQLYKQIQDQPPAEFWVTLKNVAGVDAPTAQKYASLIRKWYLEDIGIIPKEILESNDSVSQDLRSPETNDSKIQQKSNSSLDNNENNELIKFGHVALSLPKRDLKKQWMKLQKYMEIYLEDYVEELELPQEPSVDPETNEE